MRKGGDFGDERVEEETLGVAERIGLVQCGTSLPGGQLLHQKRVHRKGDPVLFRGKNLHKSKGGSAKAPAPKQFQMLIDIQAKMAEGKTVGYEKWAKKFNRKEAARTVILLKEKGLGNYDDLTAHIENLSARGRFSMSDRSGCRDI